MVAGTDYYNAFIAGAINLFCPIFSSSAFYLYLVLILLGGRMKRWLVLFIAIVSSLVFIAYNNSNIKNIISGLAKKGDIQSGELRYRIYLLGIFPVCEATFGVEKTEEYQGQRIYHLNATAQSLKIFSKFFSGYAILDSYVDIKQLIPMVFKQKIVISGKQSIDREVSYDQKNGIMSIAGVKRQIFPNTHDLLSAIFNIRHLDFDKVKEIKMNINTNQKNYTLKGTAQQKDISIDKKIYKIIVAKARIKRTDKNPYHKSSITMVLLKEKENIPILIKVFASGVLISARLLEIE